MMSRPAGASEDPAWLQSCRLKSKDGMRGKLQNDLFKHRETSTHAGGSVRVNMASRGPFSSAEKANLDPEFIRAMQEVMNCNSEDEDDEDDIWEEPEADYEGSPAYMKHQNLTWLQNAQAKGSVLRPHPGVARVRDRPQEGRNSTGGDTWRDDKDIDKLGISDGHFRPRSGTGPELSRPRGMGDADRSMPYHGSMGNTPSSSLQVARTNINSSGSPQLPRAKINENPDRNGNASPRLQRIALGKTDTNTAHAYSQGSATAVSRGNHAPIRTQQATAFSSGGSQNQQAAAYSSGGVPSFSNQPEFAANYNRNRRRSSTTVKRERIMTTLQKAINTGWFCAYGIVVKNLAKDLQYVSKDREGAARTLSSTHSQLEGSGTNDSSWYQSGMTRELAVEILRREQVGSFVIRDSNNQPGYALTIKVRAGRQPDVISHFLLLKTRQGNLALKDLTGKDWPDVKSFIHSLTSGDQALLQHLGLNSN